MMKGNTMKCSFKNMIKNNYIFLLSIVFICGIILGFLMAKLVNIDKADISGNHNELNYGIESRALTVSQISWKEYSSFRKVSFVLDGEFVINVPSDGTCVISGLVDRSDLMEVDREKYYALDGDEPVACDRVHYKLNNAKVQSEGIVKGEDAIHDAISGYRLVVAFGEDSEVLGYLPPLKDSFLEWSKEENYFSNNNYEIYLDNFKLSKTYDSDYSKNADKSTEGIKLIKTEGSALNCIIDNTNGSGDWEYNAQLPTMELWYQGAWIENNIPRC